jgi:hypothetical protein
MHESWVGVADPEPKDASRPRVQARGGLVMRAGSLVLFPDGPGSLRNLGALEKKLGRSEPMQYAMFPDIHGSREADQRKTRAFPNSNIQPTIDVAACWGTNSPEEFCAEMGARGFGGIWPSFHGDRKGKVVADEKMSYTDYLPAMLKAKRVQALHVEVFRTDFMPYDPERTKLSIREGRALQNDGNLDGLPLGETFDILRRANWTGPVSLEAPLGGMEASLGQLSMDRIVEMHAAMADTVRAQLPHIEWVPAAA